MDKEPQQDRPDEGLDRLLAAARDAPGPDSLPPALRARLIGDALAMMRPAAPAPRWRPETLLARLGRAIGGGAGGLAGASALASAALAGFWFGFAPPEPAADLLGYFWQGASVISPELADWGGTGDLWAAEDALLALVGDL